MIPFLLRVHNLQTHFFTSSGVVKAADRVSFALKKGEIVGLVGESGSGKTVTALSILRLVPDPPGKIIGGKILFENKDLLSASPAEMRALRGNHISMIFQEPMTSLNPVFTIGNQICEAIRLHQGLKAKDATDKCIEMLKLVKIPSPEKRIGEYPYQLSGGMRQRAMIAMALSCNPRLLIADEPTTALDVTIQAQILDLMNKLIEKTGTAIIMITHNFGVIAEMAERVIVMYAGKIQEEAMLDDIFYRPAHPYTKGLLTTVPRIDQEVQAAKTLTEIPGMIPSLSNLPKGCCFHPRCNYAMDICSKEEPELKEIDRAHWCRCWLF